MNRDVALVYVRVSRLDAEERERKVSPDMQRERALALPALAGLRAETFEDLDRSGKDTNRPGYRAMIERLEAGDVRYVVAYDQSRITRDLGDLQGFRAALARHGARFVESATGRVLDPDDEDAELGSNVLGSVDQHYRRKVARRVRDTLATKVAHGELVGPVPAGYARRKEILPSGKIARTWVEPDPERARIVRLAFALYASGEYTFRSLAVELNARGVALPRAPHFRNNRPPAELWTSDVLKDLLSNPRYVGRVPRRDGSTFAAAYEPLVDAETWAAVVRVRARGRPSHDNARANASRRWRSPYMLSGVLRCARCGGTMSGRTQRADSRHSRDRHSYVCYRRRVARACDTPYLAQDRLEPELLAILDEVALPAGFAEAVDAAVAAYLGANGREARGESLATIRERQRRLNEMYELGRIERADYDARSAELDRRRAELEAERPEPVLVRQRTLLRSLVDEWAELSVDERRRLVELVFAEIRADGEGIAELVPHEEWRPYMRAVVPAHDRVVAERKTGLEPATLTLAR